MCVVCMVGNLCRAGGLLRNLKEGGQGRKPLSLASDSGHATVVRLRGGWEGLQANKHTERNECIRQSRCEEEDRLMMGTLFFPSVYERDP